MVTHLPADIELSFAYRRLVESLGKENSAFVFMRLWLDLAFQSRVHGRSGIYAKEYQHHFTDALASVKTQDVQAALIGSGMVVRKANGDWFCPTFFEYNAHLDASYVPPTARWMDSWAKLEEGLAQVSRKLYKQVPSAFWYLPDGSVISETCMNRALVLVHTLDFILHRKARKPSELDIGTVQSACAGVTRHSDAILSVFLKRFMSLSRPRLNPIYPATTEESLLKLDDLIVMTSPDEGFEAWIKRVTATQNEEEEARPESISREIAERLSGI